METTAFLHSGTIGDVWAAIPAINEYYRQTGKKAILYLENGHSASYYDGATHPTRDSGGKQVMLNESVINMMIPLLNEQESIECAKIWDKEHIHIDLNLFRTTFVNLPWGCISRWQFYTYPDLACDLSGVWMTIPKSDKDFAKDKIIITRSERYRNDKIDYSFLKPFEDDIIFCGTMREYNNFCMSFDLNIRKLTISNFLELAQAIQQSKFHISNQTMAAQISAGIKKPRIVEICDFAQNVIPIGENAYDFFHQGGLVYYFHKLNGTLTEYIEEKKKAAKE
jgi:hypothetical protein